MAARIDPNIDYCPGYVCPSCRKNRLIYRETDGGYGQSYCVNCGFWDWLTDREGKFWKRVKGILEHEHYFSTDLNVTMLVKGE